MASLCHLNAIEGCGWDFCLFVCFFALCHGFPNSLAASSPSEMPKEVKGLGKQNAPLLTISLSDLSISDPTICPTIRTQDKDARATL